MNYRQPKRGFLFRMASHPFISVGVILAILVIGGAVLAATTGYFNKEQVTIVVKGKESVATGAGDDRGHEYRVYTDHGTFVVEDSLIYTRFDSADVYGNLDVGKRYTCETYGLRIPVLSSFKNLLDCRPA